MKVVTCLLYTAQPLLATSLQGDPNSSVSFPYIPGSILRGALIGRYLANEGHGGDIATDGDARRLFLDGRTRYLNAYLYNMVGDVRTLPTPRCWFRDKGVDFGDEVRSIALRDVRWPEEADDENGADGWEDFTPTALSERFCAVEDDGDGEQSVVLYRERRRITVHTQRDRMRGRAVAGSGTVFRYDALDSGQVFQAVVLCDDGADADTIVQLLNQGELWMGGSRSAGYGQVRIDRIRAHDTWSEVAVDGQVDTAGPMSIGTQDDANVLTLALLSDMIVRDESGQHVAALPVEQLAALLGVRAIHSRPGQCFIGSATIGGFNRKWGLPLPQVQALAAGSIFVLDVDGTIKQDGRRLLLERGIGEHLVDGFGRVALDWPPTGSMPHARRGAEDETRAPLNEGLPQGLSVPDGTESDAVVLAQQMARRMLRQRMERILLEQVGSINLKPLYLTKSQLSRLIIVAERALGQRERGDDAINTFLQSLTSTTRDKFERTLIDGQKLSFAAQIQAWLKKPGNWIAREPEVTVAGHMERLTAELRLEYTLRLIIAVAKKASKGSN